MAGLIFDGKLAVYNGKVLTFAPGDASANTLSIDLVPFYIHSAGARHNISTNAASDDTNGHVPIVISYTGDPPRAGFINARIVDTANAPVSGGNWKPATRLTVDTTLRIAVAYFDDMPAGIAYKREVSVETANGTLTDIDTATFNVGPMGGAHGQSNMRGTLDGNDPNGGLTGNIPGTSTGEKTFFDTNGTGAIFTPNGFVPATNTTVSGSYYPVQPGGLSLIRLVGNRLQAKFGRKVGFALNPFASNGATISRFMPPYPGNDLHVMVGGTGTSGNTIGFSSPAYVVQGDYRFIAFYQGESESSSQTVAQRVTQLKAWCRMHLAQVAKFGRPPSKLTFFFPIMAPGSPPQQEILRAAVYALIADAEVVAEGWDVRIGWNCIDLDPKNVGDTLHFGGMDMARAIRRFTQAAQNVLDPVGTPYSAEGPRLLGTYTRSGDDITLDVALNGCTGLRLRDPGVAGTGFYAHTNANFDSASGTEYAVTNITPLPGGKVRVTVAGAPPTIYLKLGGHKYYSELSRSPDVSNYLYGEFTHPTHATSAEQFDILPVQPTPVAIPITA